MEEGKVSGEEVAVGGKVIGAERGFWGGVKAESEDAWLRFLKLEGFGVGKLAHKKSTGALLFFSLWML